ncbi:hypothetical protein CUMW_059620 [Citrus unshiu]|nr:hypothetical protein CUMW_059620 [Citrus unshiu]
MGLNLQEFAFSSFPQLVHLNFSFNLFFGSNQLSGVIPPKIGRLNQLRTLYIDVNYFGKFKISFHSGLELKSTQQLKPICFSLIVMSLFNNSLSGSTPPIVGNLKSLSILGLHINQLNGFIPHSIGDLSSLRTLYLYSNALYSFVLEKVYKAFDHHPNLTFLDLSQNNFYGEILFNWRNFPNLGTFLVSMNNIFGTYLLRLETHPNYKFLTFL